VKSHSEIEEILNAREEKGGEKKKKKEYLTCLNSSNLGETLTGSKFEVFSMLLHQMKINQNNFNAPFFFFLRKIIFEK
jgi:hypothetical protein